MNLIYIDTNQYHIMNIIYVDKFSYHFMQKFTSHYMYNIQNVETLKHVLYIQIPKSSPTRSSGVNSSKSSPTRSSGVNSSKSPPTWSSFFLRNHLTQTNKQETRNKYDGYCRKVYDFAKKKSFFL